MKLWNKKYQLNQQVEDFTVGNDHLIDQNLLKYDCLASIAHAKMLQEMEIIDEEELKRIISALEEIIELDKNKQFFIKKEQEDCHTAIENYLTDKLGDLGKKIHTARSRNDQILVALRLYYRDELKEVKTLVKHFIKALVKFSDKFNDVVIPGFTHTRKAMPSSVKMWTDSFADSMRDNLKLTDLSLELINQSPLGTGAGYGIPLSINRKLTADLLGFNKVQNNPIYSQNSRGKFESTILHSLSQITTDLSKISNDLIFFTQSELGYFKLPDEFCTGSSIMPQKKNPDVLELTRAKHNLIVSFEFQIKNMMNNIISGYHRDFQLFKEPLIRGFQETKNCLNILSLIFDNLDVDKLKCRNAMTSELYATQKVYNLVEKGMNFRDAYQKISKEY
jgi:argininosuccinate lyase